jgi:hypothetical protein
MSLKLKSRPLIREILPMRELIQLPSKCHSTKCIGQLKDLQPSDMLILVPLRGGIFIPFFTRSLYILKIVESQILFLCGKLLSLIKTMCKKFAPKLCHSGLVMPLHQLPIAHFTPNSHTRQHPPLKQSLSHPLISQREDTIL